MYADQTPSQLWFLIKKIINELEPLRGTYRGPKSLPSFFEIHIIGHMIHTIATKQW